MDGRVHKLASNLQDTTRNLRSLDHMLDQYKDMGHQQRSSVDRLRDDLARTHGQIEDERSRSPRYRDYGSDSEYEGSPTARKHRRKRRSTVRFADDMNRELHDIHQSVRDLSSDHMQLEESLTHEMDRRDRYDLESRRTMRDITDTLKRVPHSDPVAARVEKRLQQIQTELRADRLSSDRHDEVGSLSADLRHALQGQQQYQQAHAQVDEKLRSQYLQSEAHKYKIDAEMESLKRKLDHSEGSRSALTQQVDDLRRQLSRIDKEREQIKSQLDESRLEDEMRDRRRRKSLDEDRINDRRGLERELQEMRGQLARSVGVASEHEELRRGIEKSERQRAQLSDHIETITKDLENREKQTAKLINQLKDVSDKYEDAERHRNQLLAQFEDTMTRLKDSNKELEKTSNELRNTQQSLQDAEKKKEEFKGRAQETVRQWKMKVKQLEREVDRQKHGSTQMIQRNEQLVKEMEGMRHQNHLYGVQMENMKRELGDALAVRAAQDEQLRLREVEVNELKSVRMDMDRELRDTHTVADRLENEVQNAQARVASLSEERGRLEDKLSSVEAAHALSQDQANQLQHELKELSTVKADCAARLSEANAKNHDLRANFIEIQHREQAQREEGKMYQRRMAEEREAHHAALEKLKKELNEAKVREAHITQDVQRRLKRDRAEYEAALAALKLENSEDKSALKITKRNEEKFRKEAEIMQKEAQRFEEENHKLMNRLEMARHEYETQTQMAETDMSRVKKIEDELFAAQTQSQNFARQYEALVQDMVAEIDALLEIVASGSPQKYQTVVAVKGAPNGPKVSIADMKSKLKWLRSEMRERCKHEQTLKKELREALNCNDNDRRFLLTELAKREEVLDELSAVKDELTQREMENLSAVDDLEEKILDLTDELQLRKIREEEVAKQRIQVIDDMEDLKMVHNIEKERIEERYLRLQDTMKSLQHEIQSVNVNNPKGSELQKNIHNLKRATPKKRNPRVRVPDRAITPPVKLVEGH